MQVKHVLFVMYCAVQLLLHVADSQEYCKFEGPSNQYAHCSPSDTNRTFNYVPRISHRIELLDLEGRPLEQLPRNAFGNITTQTELQTIHLAYCRIQHIDVDAFENLGNLEYLNMTGNSISRLETGTFQHTKKLMRLGMSSNKIDKLQTGLFHDLIYLKEVSFENNSITSIDKITFRNTPSLMLINLQYNKLENLSPLFTDNFVNITDLYIGGNPWHSACILREFREKNVIGKWLHADLWFLFCQNPPALRDQRCIELIGIEYECVVYVNIIVPWNDRRVVTLGSNVTLTCTAIDRPVSYREWRRGSHIIARHNRLAYPEILGHQLNYTFTVQEADLRVYFCLVHNPGEIEKSSTTLTMDVTRK